jgi:hypothetical protein
MIKEQPRSPLLRLPAELRNRIYEYALTANGDLMYTFWGTDHKSIICDSAHDADSSRPVSVGATEFNRFKYVCLKLCAETAAIELKLNALNVHGQYHLPVTRPAYGFSCFVQQLSPSKHAWLAHVVLELTASNWPKNDLSRLLMEGPSSFIEIAKFCVKNPQIKVNYIVRAFSTHLSMRYFNQSYSSDKVSGRPGSSVAKIYAPWHVRCIWIALIISSNFLPWRRTVSPLFCQMHQISAFDQQTRCCLRTWHYGFTWLFLTVLSPRSSRGHVWSLRKIGLRMASDICDRAFGLGDEEACANNGSC